MKLFTKMVEVGKKERKKVVYKDGRERKKKERKKERKKLIYKEDRRGK